MKKEYITIQGWQYELGITDITELFIFALIYGFSQDGNSRFYGSLSYISKRVLVSKPTLIKKINNLIDKGLIIKEISTAINTSNSYYANLDKIEELLSENAETEVVKKLNEGSKETLQGVVKKFKGGSKETLHNNNNYNYKDIIINNNISQVQKNELDEFIKEYSYLDRKEARILLKDKHIKDFLLFVNWLNTKFKRNFRINRTGLTNFKRAIKNGYTPADIAKAAINMYSSDYHKKNKYKYLTIEFCTRPQKIEIYLSENLTIK